MDMYENIKLYIETLEKTDYAYNTLTSYEIHLRHFYSYCRQKNVDYKNITTKQMLVYKNLTSEKYSFQSLNAKVSTIKGFYNFLIDIEEAEKNPVRDNMYVRKNRAKPRPLGESEKELFMEFIETKEKHIELGFALMFDTGIRVSELVRLEKQDIRIINGRIFLYISNAKNNNTRLVPIFSQQVIGELMEYNEMIYEGKLFNYSTRTYQLYAEEFKRKFNITFTTHMCRHTFATRKLNEGLRIDILKEILGHKDIRTTMYYAVTNESEILKLGGLFNE